MRPVILVRSSDAWRKGKIDRPWGHHLAKCWARAFGSSYEEFRRELRNISFRSFGKMRPEPIVAHYPDDAESYCKSEGNLLMPTDEDDWFRSDAAEVLLNQPAKITRWRYMELGPPDRFRNLLIGDDWTPHYRHQSNNCSFPSPVPPELLVSHRIDFLESSGGARMEENLLDLNLSVHNKTPASLSYRHTSTVTPETLVADMEKHIQCDFSSVAELDPFEEEIGQLKILMKKLMKYRIHL